MIHIEIADVIEKTIDLDPIEDAARETLRYEHTPEDADITILLSGDEQVSELNKQYLGIDETTDVLSFPADFVDPDTTHTYLGDIIISYPKAKAQAEAGGHSLENELILLVVHGILHLLGYDHMDEEEKKDMWAVQANILNRLNCPISPP